MKLFQLAIALCAMGLSVNNCAAQTPNTAAPMQGMQKKTATVQSTTNNRNFAIGHSLRA